eukprot:tig00001130_g7251.t1
MAGRIFSAIARDLKQCPEIIALAVPVTIASSVAIYTGVAKSVFPVSNDVAFKKEDMQGALFVKNQKFENVAPMSIWSGYSDRFLGFMSAIPEEFHKENMEQKRAEQARKHQENEARLAAEMAAFEKGQKKETKKGWLH